MGNIFKRKLYIAKVDKLSQGNRNRKEPLPGLFSELLKSYFGILLNIVWGTSAFAIAVVSKAARLHQGCQEQKL